MLLLFIPIGILVDVSEKIDKFKEFDVPFNEIVNYYIDFVWYFGNILYPLFVFLSVVWFTSKIANNSEIIAILSSGISFNRYLRPFMIASSIIAIIAFYSGMFIVPEKNKSYNEFYYKYLKKGKKSRTTSKIYKQIDENDFVYVSNYNPTRELAYDFSYEHFENNILKYKISARNIRWIEEDSDFITKALGKNGKNILYAQQYYFWEKSKGKRINFLNELIDLLISKKLSKN